MSDRRRIPRIHIRRRPIPSRARTFGALGAAIALVAMAGFIGSHGRGSSDDASTVAKVAASSAATATRSRADAPTTASGSDAVASGASGSTGATDSDLGVTANESKTSTEAPTPEGYTTSKGTQTSAPDPLGAKIVRTGSLQLEVKRGTFGDAVADLTSTATGVGGFVSASETSQLGDDPSGTITLRVPARQFDRLLSQIAKLGKVTAVTTGSQDVTGEYTDTAARIKALQDERDQISLVLSKAESIPDILAVRDRMSAVQSELEQLQGRKQVLDDQTSLSTITVSLSEQGRQHAITTAPTPERSGFSKVWHDAGDRFTGGARNIALGAAAMAPWLLLGLGAWLVGRVIWRRTAPATVAAAAGPAPTAAE